MPVVLLSGGQDSATCLAWAFNERCMKDEQFYLLSFAYGQRHAVEIEAAKKVAGLISVQYGISYQHTVLDLQSVFAAVAGGTSGLIGQDKEIVTEDGRLPTSVVPGRNMIFGSIAASFAAARGIRNVVMGVCQTDYSGYPDCRNTFVSSLNTTTRLAFDHPQYPDVTIHTPLMFKTKAETFAMAKRLGVLGAVLHNTVTCYMGYITMNEWGKGCGACPSCILRRKGWEEYKSQA